MGPEDILDALITEIERFRVTHDTLLQLPANKRRKRKDGLPIIVVDPPPEPDATAALAQGPEIGMGFEDYNLQR